jgi:putative chitinase
MLPILAGLPVSAEALGVVMPHLRGKPRIREVAAALEPAARDAELNTRLRMTAFLAQVAHESGELRWLEELPHRNAVHGCSLCDRLIVEFAPEPLRYGPLHGAGEQYEGRKDLGNTEPGDGVRFKGRGPIQLTGRANYRAAGKALGLPLEEHPERAANLDVGLRVAAWYWRTRKCNEPADVGDFPEVTRRVNGGYNGLAERTRYYERALRALGAT